MQNSKNIVILYTIFAAITTGVNIGAQYISILIYNGIYSVPISVLVGTGIGLPLKYVLEKKYIFLFKSKNVAHDGKLFVIYSIMGVFTTAIFWATEFLFHYIFHEDFMRYLGGIIGLSIGYYVKYKLDKKYVFV